MSDTKGCAGSGCGRGCAGDGMGSDIAGDDAGNDDARAGEGLGDTFEEGQGRSGPFGAGFDPVASGAMAMGEVLEGDALDVRVSNFTIMHVLQFISYERDRDRAERALVRKDQAEERKRVLEAIYAALPPLMDTGGPPPPDPEAKPARSKKSAKKSAKKPVAKKVRTNDVPSKAGR